MPLTSQVDFQLEIIQTLNNIFNPDNKDALAKMNELLKKISIPRLSENQQNEIINILRSVLFGDLKSTTDKRKIAEVLIIFLEDLKDQSDEILDKCNEFQDITKIDEKIYETKTLLICDCGNIFIEKLPKGKICFICEKKLTIKDCKQKVPINVLKTELIRFIEKNIWFEEGTAQLCRRNDFKTKVGCYIKGQSSILHEIDILAYNKRGFIIIECKTKDVTLDMVFKVYSKSSDLNSFRTIIITMEKIDPLAFKFAIHHNIIVIQNAKNPETIMDNLKVIKDKLDKMKL